MKSRRSLEITIINNDDALKQFEWGEIIDNKYKVYTCHEHQLAMLQSEAKFTFGFAGTGGGKTCLIPLWLYKQIKKKPKGRFLVVSPSEKVFKDSELHRHIIEVLRDTIYEGKYNLSGKSYQLGTGGEIVIKTCGDGGEWQRLVGGQYDAVAADEVYFLSAEVWNEMRRRGGKEDCPFFAVTTPNNNSWIYDIKLEYERGNKDYYVRQWATLENPTYKKESVEREKAVLSDAVFKRMYMGEFAALEGLVFDCFGDRGGAAYPVVKIVGNPIDNLPSKPIFFFGGNDWGYKPDPACVLMMAECEDGIIYVVDEIYGTEITPDDLAIKVRDMVDRWSVRADSAYAEFVPGGKFRTFWSDTSRPEAMKSFRRAGISINKKRVENINAGLGITDSWFRAGKLIIFSNCVNLIRECEGYQWEKDRRGELKDTPKSGNEHAIDALRYAISSQKHGVAVTPIERLSVTDDEQKELDIEKLKKLQLINSESELKDLAEKKQNDLFYQLAFGDLLSE